MNASLVLVTAAWLAGADTPAMPAPMMAPAPAMAAPMYAPAPVSGPGCTNCGAAPSSAPIGDGCGCADACAPKKGCLSGLLSKFQGMGKGRSHGGCDTCGSDACPVRHGCRPVGPKTDGVLTKLRGLCHKKASCDTCGSACESACGGGGTGCALPAAPGTLAPAAPVTAPSQMPGLPPATPAPAPAPKESVPAPSPKTTLLPIPTAPTVPSVRVLPVGNPGAPF